MCIPLWKYCRTSFVMLVMLCLFLTACGEKTTSDTGLAQPDSASGMNHLRMYYLCHPSGNFLSGICTQKGTIGLLPILNLLQEKNPDGKAPLFLTGDLFQHSQHKKNFLETMLAEVSQEVLVDVYKSLNVAAILPGLRDAVDGIDDYKNLASKCGLKPVCANLISQENKEPVFSPYVMIDYNGIKLGVTGLMSKKMVQTEGEQAQKKKKAKKLNSIDIAKFFKNDPLEILDPMDTAKSITKTLKAEGADFVVVLSALGIQVVNRVLAETDADIVIGNDMCRKSGYKPVKGGVRMQTEILATTLGRFDYRYKDGVKGVSGDQTEIDVLKLKMAKHQELLDPLIERYGTTDPAKIRTLATGTEDYAFFSLKTNKIKELKSEETRLSKDVKDSFFRIHYIPTSKMPMAKDSDAWQRWLDYGDRLKPLTKDHEEKIISEYMPIIEKAEMAIKPEACSECHSAQYEHWKGTAHASTFESVYEVNAEYNPVCIQCHTSGFCKKNGFVILPPPEGMDSVNCDVCHTSAAAHLADCFTPTVRLPIEDQKQVANFCTQCHNNHISPKFRPMEKIKRIACPKIDYSSPMISEIFTKKAEELKERLNAESGSQNIEDYTKLAYLQNRLDLSLAERIELLTRALEQDPNNRQVVLMLYPLLSQNNDNPGALKIIEDYLSQNPTDMFFNKEIMRMLIIVRDPTVHNAELGREYIRWWLENLGRDDIEIYMLLAAADIELGYLDEGLEAVIKAQDMEPSEQQAAIIQQLRSQYEEAGSK